jgi:hypothetical protein
VALDCAHDQGPEYAGNRQLAAEEDAGQEEQDGRMQ